MNAAKSKNATPNTKPSLPRCRYLAFTEAGKLWDAGNDLERLLAWDVKHWKGRPSAELTIWDGRRRRPAATIRRVAGRNQLTRRDGRQPARVAA